MQGSKHPLCDTEWHFVQTHVVIGQLHRTSQFLYDTEVFFRTTAINFCKIFNTLFTNKVIKTNIKWPCKMQTPQSRQKLD